MASSSKSPATVAITIRNLEASVKTGLRLRAARHGRSMEEEARHILRTAVTSEQNGLGGLSETIRRRFADVGGADLPDLPRGPMREPPRFD